MTSRDRAFLLLALDITQTPPAVRGAAVFSEERPTQDASKIRWATLVSTPGADYEEALAQMRCLLSSPWYAWVAPLLSDQTKASLDRAAARRSS